MELIVLAGAIVFSIFIIIVVTNSLMRPLKEMKNATNEIANGNLKVSIDYASKDELGAVCNSMREMIYTINSYIMDITRGMKALSDGDLTATPNIEYKGDFVELKDSIIQAIEAFNSTLSQIATSADQVTSGSEQVSSGAQALSQGSTEQASAIGQLAASMNAISDQINDNADNAQMVNEKVGLMV